MVPLWYEMHSVHIPFSPSFYKLRSKQQALTAIRKHFQDSIKEEGALIYVAVDGQEIVGYLKAKLTGRPPVFPTSHKVVLLDSVIIKQSYRQQGIFLEFQKRLEADARKLGAKHIQLSVDMLNSAKQVYEKAGYRPRQVLMVKSLAKSKSKALTSNGVDILLVEDSLQI